MKKGLNFRTIESQKEYFETYDDALKLMFSQMNERYIATSYGDSHVICSGDDSKSPLVLLHAASCGSPIWYKNVSFWSRYFNIYAIDLIGESSKSILTRKMQNLYKLGVVKKSLILVIMLLCLSGCQRAVSSETALETVQETMVEQEISAEQKKIIEDIQMIKQVISNSPCSKEYCQEDFDMLIDDMKIGNIDREQCYQRIREIMSSCHCVHLNIWTKPNDPIYVNCLPIELMWFGDELRIAACMENNREYLGMKVVQISGYSIDDVAKKYGSINSYETERGKLAFLEAPFWETDLRYLGLLDSSQNTVQFVIEDELENTEKLNVELVSWDKCNLRRLEEMCKEIPISYRNRAAGVNYCYEGDSEHGIMYFFYAQCMEMENYSLEQCFADMINEVMTNSNYDEIVFDVRWNGGGNRWIMQPLLEKYRDELAQMKISIIVGKNTYSAAFQFVEDCMQLFDEVFIYGEETGQAITNYTEIKEIDLPALNCTMVIPTVEDYVPEIKKRYSDLERGIIPDIEVYQTYEDYLNGIDTIYKAICE